MPKSANTEHRSFLRGLAGPASLGAAAAVLLAGSAVFAHAGPPYGGFYGRYFVPDGTQERMSRHIPGAAPTAWATADGVRCSYMFVVRNGVRERYYICD